MREWIEQFLEEVGDIELFFNTKYEELAQEFEILKEMYIRKKETKKDEKKEKKLPDFQITNYDDKSPRKLANPPFK